MPLFSGRLSLSGWNRESPSSAPSRGRNSSAESALGGGGGGSAWTTRGRRRTDESSGEAGGEGTTASKGKKPPRSKSALLARRISTPIRPAALAKLASGGGSGGGALSEYERRAGTFSKSSPDLCSPPELVFQPFATLSPSPPPPTSPTSNATRRRDATPSPTKRRLVPPQTVRHSPGPSRDSDDDVESEGNSSDDEEPRRRRDGAHSDSPPQSLSVRAAAHAKALAQLTAGASSSSPSHSPSNPFNSSPPPPTRPPPALPFHSTSSDEAPSLTSSSDASHHSSPSLRIEDRSSRRISGERRVLQPTTPGASRVRKVSVRVARSGEETEEGFARGVGKVRRFLERELGKEVGGEGGGEGEYEEPERVAEAALSRSLLDGVVLCRLVNHLSPSTSSPPIPPLLIDTRGLPTSSLTNLSHFLSASGSLYALPTTDLFSPVDLSSQTRFGLRRVVHTLLLLEARSSSSSTGTLPSSPPLVPAKSRPVRRRSANYGGAGGSSGHGRDGSASTMDVQLSSSPASSRFTDSSGTTSSARVSLDLPNPPSITSVTLTPPPPSPSSSSTLTAAATRATSPTPTGSGPSVSFAHSQHHHSHSSPSNSSSTSSSSSASTFKNKIYGDRRLAESAIDVLSVVEEDEGSSRSRNHRYSQPVSSMTSRDDSPPPPLPRVVSPTPATSSSAPRRSKSTKLSWLDTTSPSVQHAPLASRKRHSSESTRPVHLLGQHRAFSHSHTQPSPTERDEFGSIHISPDLARRSTLAPSPSDSIPFPGSSSDEAELPVAPPTTTTAPPHSRKHKRWNSELHIEKPVGGGGRGGDDEFQFPPVNPPRSRHQSYAGGEAKGSSASSSQPAARTKLVLREDGRPTLTYQLGECIGRGQFGSVYRALNLNSGRVVAVKRIQLAGKSEEEVNQLSNEVAMLKSLVHPGVVKYEGVVRTEHYVNIILEYVENGSLQKTIKHFGELPESLVASYVVKILEGLDYLHSSQVVHCDLKAANILSTKTGNIKLSDFGVSLNLNAVQNIKQDVADVQGTPNWMAPEVIELRGASTASDIWSLACTVIELITGKPPYAELNAMSAMFRIVEDERPPIPPRCSPELADFLCQCFAKDPRQRPTAAELFDHEWLTSHWEMHKELRPQDSIPFIRRISSDMRRPELNLLGGITERSQSSIDLAFYASNSPVSQTAPTFPDPVGRRSPYRQESIDAISAPTVTYAAPNHEIATDESHRAHAFVKTTFSKAVDCKLCHEPTKRHAVLCKDCGLISHARCSEWAPLPCDLRSQLVNYSKSYIPPHPSSPPMLPSSPPTGTSAFSLAVILPFSNKRRSAKPSNGLGIAPSEVSLVPSTSTPPRARRHFSDIIKPRSRSPERTSREGSVESHASGEHGSVGSHAGRASLEVAPAPAVSAISLLLARRSSESPLKRRTSYLPTSATTSPPQPSTNASKLLRKKSHSRSFSQPAKKGSEDCAVQ